MSKMVSMRVATVALIAVLIAGCLAQRSHVQPTVYEDGTYRGMHASDGHIEVSVEFTLRDGVVTAISFRHLFGKGDAQLGVVHEPYRSIVAQYQELLDYLVGKDLRQHLAELYQPGDIVVTRVDGYSGATIRSGKVISAIRDGLNRGVYSY